MSDETTTFFLVLFYSIPSLALASSLVWWNIKKVKKIRNYKRDEKANKT